MNEIAINLTDGYKVDHRRQYHPNTRLVYSNLTPRKSKDERFNHIIFYGLQYFMKRYLVEGYNKWFALDTQTAVKQYERRINNYLPPNHGITFEHIKELHDLGYLPIEIKSLPEGTLVPMKIPPITIVSTDKRFFWLVNYLETILSTTIWQPCTSATTAYNFKKLLNEWAMKTVGNTDFVPFQAHDFSFRGMPGLEAACMSGSAHLTSFVGTDTIPAIDFLEEYYNADSDKEMVGVSVAASEHSVMCSGTGFYIYDKYNGDWSYQGEAEYNLFEHLITEVYPNGIISLVSDTFSLWRVVTEYLPKLKDKILARDGKLVLRPDSSPKTPVEILCGDSDAYNYSKYNKAEQDACFKGLVEALWDIFGGTVSDKGYKILDSHIGCIYGDSITYDRASKISELLSLKGFASINCVYGVGSFTYQYVTRDNYSFAMKATYCEVEDSKGNLLQIPIFKDPKTDDGMKKSAKGLLKVVRNKETNELELIDNVSWEEEKQSLLQTIFLNGKILHETSLSEIRDLISKQ